MNGGAVKRCFTFINTQEACTLGKGGVSKTGDLKERLAVSKASVLVSVRDDVLCNRRIDACNAVQEGGGGGIEIDTDMVYGVLYSSIQCLPELLLADIVLILSILLLFSGTYNSENDPKLHYSKAIFIKTAINYISMPIVWFVMLCSLTCGIKGVAGLPHPKDKDYSGYAGDPSSKLIQSGAVVMKNKAIDWRRRYRNNRKQSDNANSTSEEKQNHTTSPAASVPPPQSALPSVPGS